MTSELQIECRLARDYTMENVPDAFAYLLIKAMPDSSMGFGTLPLNISLVIDVSRSMKGDKIECARQAAKMLVRSLRENDLVSVVTFSDNAKLVVPTTNVADKSRILSAIDGIRIERSTRMPQGMEMSSQEMGRVKPDNRTNRMILFTDGQTEKEMNCYRIATRERKNHVSISTLGIGKEYNEVLLAEIADTTLGRFYHLTSPEQIGAIFKAEFDSASAAVMSEVSLSLNLAPDVRLERLDRIFPSFLRLQPTSQNESKVFTVDIGTLNDGETTIVGAQLKLPAQSAGRVRIIQVSFTLSVPGLHIKDKVENHDVFLEFTKNESLCSQVDREVVGYFNQIDAQEFVEQAITETKHGNPTGATRSLVQAQDITRRLGNLPLAENIGQALNELGQTGTISEDGIKTIKASSRTTVKIDKKKPT